MDMSKMKISGKSVTAEQLAAMKASLPSGGNVETTSYYSGHKLKAVTSISTSIMDLDSQKMTILLPSRKRYMIMSLPPNDIKQLTFGARAKVLAIKATKTMLGHDVHLFKVSINSSTLAMIGYAWVAPDLPTPPSFGASNNPMFDILTAKLTGTTLKASYKIVSPSSGQLSMTSEVESLSTDPIPASVFQIPAEYTQLQAPTRPGTPAPAN